MTENHPVKIEIDLQDILHDHNGDPAESLADSIRRQVVATIATAASDGVQKRIDAAVSEAISGALAKAVEEQLPALVVDLMDAEYQPVNQYGQRAPATTLRAQLLRTIQEQMVYKKSSYDSDKNAFTKAVDSAVAAKLAEFQKEWTRQVDSDFVADALRYATEQMMTRLGLKKA
jgi:ABC-type amino acid transport substrate-binding protein